MPLESWGEKVMNQIQNKAQGTLSHPREVVLRCFQKLRFYLFFSPFFMCVCVVGICVCTFFFLAFVCTCVCLNMYVEGVRIHWPHSLKHLPICLVSLASLVWASCLCLLKLELLAFPTVIRYLVRFGGGQQDWILFITLAWQTFY